jgi:phosphoglycolate phosphatase-like HAD superfamily hydrolase
MSSALLTVLGTITAVLALPIAYLQLRRTPRLPTPLTDHTYGRLDSATAGTGPRVRQVRHNLGPRSRFVGRNRELQRLIEGLNSDYSVITIEGLGGMGKTTLASELGWRLVDNSSLARANFEAILWTEEHDGRLTLDEVLDTVVQVLELPYIRSLPLANKRKEVVRHLQHSRCLLIVDNVDARTSAEVLEFIGRISSRTSMVLTTSRERMAQGAWMVPVGRLTPADGIQYVRQESLRLGVASIADGDDRPLALYQATGGNPQAIRLTLAQINSGIVTLTEALDSLRRAANGDIFSAIFERGWAGLRDDNAPAAQALMVLALHPGTASRDALEAGIDVHDDNLPTAIGGLADLSLIEDVTAGPFGTPQFRVHPLTRAFARRQLNANLVERGTLEDRLLVYYLGFASRHADTYGEIANARHLESERINVLYFANLTHERACRTDRPGDWLQVVGYADALAQYLWGRGYWRERLALCERAVDAAQHLGDSIALARQHALIGRTHLWLGNPDRAEVHLEICENALLGATEKDRAMAKRLRAQLASASGTFDEAQMLLHDILKVAPNTTDDEGRAATLIELGVLAANQRDFTEARAYFEEALRLDERLGTTEGIAVSLSHLGNATFELREFTQARGHYERGLTLARTVDRLTTIGRCEHGLARVCVVERDFDSARRFAAMAQDTFARLGMKEMSERARLIAVSVEGRSTKRPVRPFRYGPPDLPRSKAIIFDCDDTILATAKSRWSVLIETAAAFGVILEERTIQASWGKPFDELIRSIVPSLDHVQFIEAYSAAMRAHRPQPTLGAIDLIRGLWGLGICLEIVTSSSRDLIVQDLDVLGLTSYFDNIYGFEQSQHHKPDPRVLAGPIDNLGERGIRPEEVLYVGDSVRDYRVATGNGIEFYGVLTGLESRTDFLRAGVQAGSIVPNLQRLARLLGA